MTAVLEEHGAPLSIRPPLPPRSEVRPAGSSPLGHDVTAISLRRYKFFWTPQQGSSRKAALSSAGEFWEKLRERRMDEKPRADSPRADRSSSNQGQRPSTLGFRRGRVTRYRKSRQLGNTTSARISSLTTSGLANLRVASCCRKIDPSTSRHVTSERRATGR